MMDLISKNGLHWPQIIILTIKRMRLISRAEIYYLIHISASKMIKARMNYIRHPTVLTTSNVSELEVVWLEP